MIMETRIIKLSWGGMPPDPPKWCAIARYSIAPSNFLNVAFCPPL